jgi:hypothetical protein
MADAESKAKQDGTLNNDFFDFNSKGYVERAGEACQALIKQLSPKSAATDDEIREEVSSVGMASETLRPMHYPKPFRGAKEDEKEDAVATLLVEASQNKESEEDSSTLTSTDSSTLTSESNANGRPKKKRGHKKSKRTKDTKSSDHPEIQQSNSGSTRSKMLWKGWKKTIGKVKKIVQEIDEQRINQHPHVNHPKNVKRE